MPGHGFCEPGDKSRPGGSGKQGEVGYVDVRGVLSRQLVIGEMLARQARKNPGRVALVDGGRKFTYHQLNSRVNRLAGAFSQLGVGKGDRVAILLFNCSQMVECYFALAKLGALAVPVNFRLVGREVAYIVNHSGSSVLVYDSIFHEMVKMAGKSMPVLRHSIVVGDSEMEGVTGYEEFLSRGDDAEPEVIVEDDDPALIMYTSGTTGRPKGAVLTHKNKMVNCVNCIIELGLKHDDVYLCVPPLFHTAALAVMLMMVFLGGTTVLVRQFEPSAVVDTASREKVTVTFLVPAMWNALLMVPGLGEKMKTLRLAITGAAIMPLSLKEAVLRAIPGVGLVDAFGQTEMSPVTTLLKPEDTLRKGASVGRLVVNVEARVVDDDGREVPTGEVGEIVYRGPTMLKEYYRDPESTAEAMRGGWFHSGDLVRVDEEGYVYVVDCKKDMVISGGENVYPAEVEEVLYRHEKVLEAAVIGVPDEKWGERVHAVVVPKPGTTLTVAEVMEWCSSHLAGYKKPRTVSFVETLPRNASGKVLKNTLREWFKN